VHALSRCDLEVFYQSRIAPNPGEEPFDDPSARVCGEANFGRIFAHDFDGNQRGRGGPSPRHIRLLVSAADWR
jgi:hypothetical protein